ncbi:uncharacterized protein LOC111069407 [Drosophila obscura]|uniref:uncharacterized protein LOC111069407 n=1 Tax=Drosophila obscura TaxID=7282 RepID=UPI000BA15257|nr:uncharacterized protein LOC111069407 [Drosophila obscura]
MKLTKYVILIFAIFYCLTGTIAVTCDDDPDDPNCVDCDADPENAECPITITTTTEAVATTTAVAPTTTTRRALRPRRQLIVNKLNLILNRKKNFLRALSG